MRKLTFVFLVTVLALGVASAVLAQGTPGGRPVDVQMALHNPHEFAWQLFLAANLEAYTSVPGKPSDGAVITKYSPDKPVVWETWALVSGGRAGSRRSIPNRSEVYLDRGAKPADWGTWNRPKTHSGLEWFSSKQLEFLKTRVEKSAIDSRVLNAFRLDKSNRYHLMTDPSLPARAKPLFEGGRPTADEVRMNRAAYDHIRDNRLYSVEGLEAAFTSRQRIVFPNSAQEVKAQWVLIKEEEKDRYHWRTINGPDGKPQLWGLSGWHIITHDLPNWFWCSFEHVDYLPFAERESDDPTTRGSGTPFRGKVDGERKETSGSKWTYYRFRGVQVDFADSRGFPTILANTQIEKGIQQTSSCITCHARATVGMRTSDPSAPVDWPYSLPVLEEDSQVLLGSIGYPNRKWY